MGVDALEYIFSRSQATHVTDQTAVMIPQREILDPQKALPAAGYVIPPDRPVPSVQRDNSKMANRILAEAILYSLRDKILEGGIVISLVLRDVVVRGEVIADGVFEIIREAVLIAIERGHVA